MQRNVNLTRHVPEQIEKYHYADKLVEAEMKTIYKYGIACYKKGCRVVCEKNHLRLQAVQTGDVIL